MANLLIGDTLTEEFYRLHTQLRLSTREMSALRVPGGIDFYTPWACALQRTENEIDPILVREPRCERGGLVTDSALLDAIRDWTANEVITIQEAQANSHGMQDALPGAVESWLPVKTVDERTQALFREGRRLLLTSDISFCRQYFELIDFVIPITSPAGKNRGFSSHNARGVIFRSFPPGTTVWDVGIDLAHELGHQTLFVWQSVDPILASDVSAPVYSLIRKAFRPAIQSFHAAVALAYMLKFTRAYSSDAECRVVAKKRGARYADSLDESLKLAISALQGQCKFTEIGQELLREMEMLLYATN